MYYILMCRSMTAAQKTVRMLQNGGLFAAVTKAPQSANPQGCTYGAKIASRNLRSALELMRRAGLPLLKILETDGTEVREVHV